MKSTNNWNNSNAPDIKNVTQAITARKNKTINNACGRYAPIHALMNAINPYTTTNAIDAMNDIRHTIPTTDSSNIPP